ncbi:LysR substrate-binding domain-containing protein [Gilvimarinus sp. SDUM040013]|uniref:LysR substrate-binding domain-containing protein n=1 Tax=Gilvimarinus gilvus TaxID=3058038 RepID=A0ABU4S3N0_9GAMM|nr:LysR family transcriptional regulator [Gilvimarinus sp. SDUM040013]MDO3385466.1 LysR substrate-binding domain-containing protein [Gilvimarinus sp. SDUM040013]MDX6851117.1 LysR substrate-binding domain-containing protein [Gilvimarinus sp. SDUM040013]
MKNETIDLKALRVFMAVAEHLNFTHAGHTLGIPKSQISKIVAQLEARLQTPLFARTSRVVRLTEAGRILALRARALLEEADLMVEDVKGLQHSVNGELRLAAPPALGRFIARDLVPLFLQQWPDARVALKLSYDYEDLFKEGLDLAFRMGTNRDDSLIEKPLGYANRVVVAAPKYLQQQPPINSPQDLTGHRCLQVFAAEMSTWTMRNGNISSTITLPALFQCDDMQALLNVLLEGVGVAQMPWLVVRDHVYEGRLQEVLPGWVSEGLSISAVYRQGLNKPAKLAEFIALVDEHIHLFDLARH